MVILLSIIIILALGTIVWFQSRNLLDINATQKEGGELTKSFRNKIRKYAWGWVAVALLTTSLLCTGYYYGADRAKEVTIEYDSLMTSTEQIDVCLNRMESVDKTKLLIEAIGYVESGNNPSCPGGGEMQITKVCVDAANKFQNKVHYDYQDRYSREKSIEIWHIIQNNCNKHGDIERAIRLWNGGPGYTIPGTQAYYEKVMRRYNYLIDNELDKICRHYKSLSLK